MEQENIEEVANKLSKFNIFFWCTDNFSTYNLLPTNRHLIGKSSTQRIEHENLTLYNRIKRLNRKTLSYSKSPEIHDNDGDVLQPEASGLF